MTLSSRYQEESLLTDFAPLRSIGRNDKEGIYMIKIEN